MKTASGCKLFGAQQALTGIRDAVVLLHSVVGCHFGSLALHASACHMTGIRQTCTVIHDSDIVFSGEASARKALDNIAQLYDAPKAVFLVTGCVSDIIQDDIRAVAREFMADTGLPVLPVEAAGYRGRFHDGFETALLSLADWMEPQEKAAFPTVNILGFGADDPRLASDLAALEGLLAGKARLGTVFADCTVDDIRRAPAAGLNLVFGRGEALAREMRQRFGTPYVCLDYPCGLVGAKALWACLHEQFALDYAAEEAAFRRQTGKRASAVYSYLQALYGLPVAVVAVGARARGLAACLSREFGMEVEAVLAREEIDELEDVYDRLRKSDTAILFASSFEQELADALGIPLVRVDYPMFDRVCLTPRPYLGVEGTLCLLEDILNESMAAKKQKGALYQ